MKPIAVGLLAVTAVLVVSACGNSDISSHGTFTVEENCSQAWSDYPDIASGDQVVVTNSAGNVIGTGDLGNSHQVQLPGTSGMGTFGDTCVYPFNITVPSGLARYGVTISHRGTVWLNQSQMEKGAALSLGS